MKHAPESYRCPICADMAGAVDEFHSPQDVVYEDDAVFAFISPHWWDGNPGQVLVVPRGHFENLYLMPDEVLARVFATVKRIGSKMRETYEGCRGIALRQHNEPLGGQDVWHFHVHVVPCYEGGGLPGEGEFLFAKAEKRHPYAAKLRAGLDDWRRLNSLA